MVGHSMLLENIFSGNFLCQQKQIKHEWLSFQCTNRLGKANLLSATYNIILHLVFLKKENNVEQRCGHLQTKFYLRQENIYWSIVIIILLWRTKQVLKTVLLSGTTLSLSAFRTHFAESIKILISLMWYPIIHIRMIWLRLNRQSFYHCQKWQLVPTARFRFRFIGKLIRSGSVDQVAYRY